MARHGLPERGSRRSLRRALVLVGVSLLFVSALVCRRANWSERDGSTMTVAVSSVSVLLSDESDAEYLVFLPLLRINESGEVEGQLAESWEHSDDYREWTYYLRRNVRWHDGRPVTARDVKFTFDLLTDHPDANASPPELVSVIDDSTVRIVANDYGYQSDVVFYPCHVLKDLDPDHFWEWPFWRAPEVGNGPYRFVRHVPQTMIEFRANPDYYRGAPKIERLVLKFVGEGGITELLADNVDMVVDANPVEFPKVAADPRFDMHHEVRPWGAQAIYWQHKSLLFSDQRVRRALAMAIDRPEMLRAFNLPDRLPLFDGPVTARQFHLEKLPEPLPYDPVKSRALLDEAGWRDSDGDGVREREGEDFRFTAHVASGFFGLNDDLAVYIQAQFQKVGVAMDVKPMHFNVVGERLRNGEIEAAFYPVILGVHDEFFLQGSPVGYTNDEIGKLLRAVQATAAPDETDRIYCGLQRIFQTDQPITYLRPLTSTSLVHRRVRGSSDNLLVAPLRHIEHLRLEDDE